MSGILTAIAFLRSPFGRIVGGVVLAALAFGYIYNKGDSNGAARIQHKWDAAVVAAGQQAGDARERAERDTPPLAPAPTPVPDKNCTPDFPRARNDGMLADDPFNRLRRRK